jgi:LDH2 family malate/lactate/ureidoglycolate dehydrogenase
VLPFGGHKGYGIALMIDILSGALSGAGYGPHLGPLWQNSETHQNLGFFLLAIDIASFRDVADFKRQIDQMIDELKASKPAPDFNEILIPGEIEFRNEQYNREYGISVGPGVLRDLTELQREFGLDMNLAAHLQSV